MPDLKMNDVYGLHAWASMLANNQDSWEVPEAKAQINFFGNDDSAYLVIDVYTSDTSSTQYTFIAENENDKPKAIIHIFDFLKTVDFSLSALLAWLENASWTDSEMGDRITSLGVGIYRDHVQAAE